MERQLASLHNQLHVNVAPRKQALELLRHKIEEENRQVGGWARAGHGWEAGPARGVYGWGRIRTDTDSVCQFTGTLKHSDTAAASAAFGSQASRTTPA